MIQLLLLDIACWILSLPHLLEVSTGTSEQRQSDAGGMPLALSTAAIESHIGQFHNSRRRHTFVEERVGMPMNKQTTPDYNWRLYFRH